MYLFDDLPAETIRTKRSSSLNPSICFLFRPGYYLEQYGQGLGPKAFKIFDRARHPLGYVSLAQFKELDNLAVLKGLTKASSATPPRFTLSRKGIRALRGNHRLKRAYLAYFDQQQKKKFLQPCQAPAVMPARAI